MDAIAEIHRLLVNLIRLGTVAEVDHAAARCRVQSGELTTAPLLWVTPRAGNTREWSAPTVGEQVILLCPGGDTNQGLVLRGLYSLAKPAPGNSGTTHLVAYPDGARIEYDHQAHTLKATLPAGGSAEISAEKGITVNGPLTVNGATEFNGDMDIAGAVSVKGGIETTEDVVAGGISTMHHKHDKVQPGTGLSGEPQ